MALHQHVTLTGTRHRTTGCVVQRGRLVCKNPLRSRKNGRAGLRVI